MAAHKLVLIRHGQSAWNLENRFTGWTDVGLAPAGRDEARAAGQLLRAEGYGFDVAFTSVLKRAIHTLNIVLDELGLDFIPVHKAWQLNERHYGALQGLNKAELVKQYGEAQVKIWRRSYDTPPPPLSHSDPQHPQHDPRYAGLAAAELPDSESLKNTVDRLLPYWHSKLAPAIRAGKRVLVVAHGNSLRALIKYLDQISDADIVEMNIPTGIPLVYEFAENLTPLGHRYLGDPQAAERAAQAVAAQATGKAP